MTNSTKLAFATAIAFCSIYGCKPENTERLPEVPTGKIIKTSLLVRSETAQLKSTTSAEQSTLDLVAIQVYTFNKQVKYAYARGLFTSLDQIPPLDLNTAHQYSIETSIVIDGQNLVAKRKSDGAFYRPFTVGTAPQSTSNSFTYTNSAMSYLCNGSGDITESDGIRTTYVRPFWARYMGYVDQFTPSESTPITIIAKRVYAALKFRTEGLNSGTLEIEFTGSPLITLTKENNNNDTTVLISLGGSHQNPKSWIEDTYSESAPCSITHISTSGQRTTIASAENNSITIKRNHIHPITIKLNTVGQATISIENGPMIMDEEILFHD